MIYVRNAWAAFRKVSPRDFRKLVDNDLGISLNPLIQ